MAILIKVDGSVQKVEPENKKGFSLKEMQNLVGGLIETVNLTDNVCLVLNEEGLLLEQELNRVATSLARIFLTGSCDTDQIFLVGDAILMTVTGTGSGKETWL